MKQVRSLLCFVLVSGFVFGQSLLALAQEHPGKEHKGVAPAGGTEAAPVAAEDDSKVLNDAAAELEATDPALSVQLKDWAVGLGTGDKKGTLAKAATALEVSKPELAAKLKAMAEK